MSRDARLFVRALLTDRHPTEARAQFAEMPLVERLPFGNWQTGTNARIDGFEVVNPDFSPDIQIATG